jgi:hypothetical protein
MAIEVSLLVLISTSVCAGVLLVAEVLFRQFGATTVEGGGINGLHKYSEVYGWAPWAGARFVDNGKLTTINAKGYRGRIVAALPPRGVKRIVMLGDSVAFGLYVANEETFSYLLDARSNGLEVVNLAVQGYGFDQSLLKLEHEGLSYLPNVVVLNVCLDNDFADTALQVFLYSGIQPKPYYRMEGGELVLHDEHLRRSWFVRWADGLRRNSHLLAWMSSRTPAGKDEQEEREHWSVRKERALQDAEGVKTLCLRLTERMREEAVQHGSAFIVVLHPDKSHYEQRSAWGEAFLARLTLEGIPVIDLSREYRARGMLWENIALDPIGHLSPEGHRVAADILQAFLSQEGQPSLRMEVGGPH